MKTFRTIARAAVLAALVTLAALPAEARTKRFTPLDFAPLSTGSDYTRSPIAVGALASPADFTAELGLPRGATLTGIRLYSGGGAASRAARVVKFRSQLPLTVMAGASETAAHLDLLTPLLTTGAVSPTPGEAVVEPGHLYFVLLNCAAGTAVWAVDVDYTP